MTAQEHINQIQERWVLHPQNASDMANALNDIVHSIFGDAARIGYELLQNADDAGSASNNVEVKYYLLDKHLVIQHNGSQLDEKQLIQVKAMLDNKIAVRVEALTEWINSCSNDDKICFLDFETIAPIIPIS